MNKVIRIVVVLAFLIAIVALGTRGTAWAGKLDSGNQSPAASGYDQGSYVGARPNGTVVTGGEVVLIEDVWVTVGSCADVLLESAPQDIIYTAWAEESNNFSSQYYPGNLKSCLIEIEADPDYQPGGAEVTVCFPIPPNEKGYAYYWDRIGGVWVKTTLVAKDNQSCVNIPANAWNPAFAAMFDK